MDRYSFGPTQQFFHADEFMTDERITAYLLEELAPREAEEFEEQCFAQKEWPAAELESAEQDLIQAYLRNELSPERHERFEKNYLTTAARRERVLMARSFLHIACSAKTPKFAWQQRLQNWLAQFSPQFTVPRFASVILIAALGLTLSVVTWNTLRNRTPHTLANLSLVISSKNRSEGGRDQKVTLPLAADAVRISLALPQNEPKGATYRVQFEDIKAPLENLKIESQDDKSIAVIIPAKKLSHGQYTLKLFRKNPDGTEQRVDGSYFFNAE